MAASIEKLSKAYDFLRIPVNAYDSEQRKLDLKQVSKKDKIANLNLVYECIVSPNVKVSDEYSKLLSFSIEAYLVFFDDDDQDVYFVAEECLNKTTKSLIDSHLTRIQADLYKFIRKNGAERSLRGALVRFAELSHLIKPHKCRNYVEFLIKENTLAKIANRPEESIQNVLVGAMSKICSSFCWAMNDNELKMLIKSFLPNLSNESPVNSFRRVSANCLSIICLYSRSPYSTFHYLHEQLLNLILPLDDENLKINKSSPESVRKKFTHWGVLICFRFMIAHLSSLDRPSSMTTSRSALTDSISPSAANNETTTTTTNPSPQATKASSPVYQNKKTSSSNYFALQNLIQIYEICVYYLNCEDNRLVIASLECLQALFKSIPLKFHLFLTKKGALESSYVSKSSTAANRLLNTAATNMSRRTKTDSLLNVTSGLSNSSASVSPQLTQQPPASFNQRSNEDDSLSVSRENMSSSMDSLNTIKLPNVATSMQSQQQLLVDSNSNVVKSSDDEDEETAEKMNNLDKGESNRMISSQDSYETRTLLAQPIDLADQLAAKLELVNSPDSPQQQLSTVAPKIAFESDRSLNTSFQYENENENKPVKEPTSLIGSFYSKTNEPLVYFVRLLSYKFLLDSDKLTSSSSYADQTSSAFDLQNRVGRLKSDAAVKVLVKTVALDCCANAISIWPDLVFKKLYVRPRKLIKRAAESSSSFNDDESQASSSDDEAGGSGLNETASDAGDESAATSSRSQQQQLHLYELITYVIHPDDKMRMNACILVGQLVNAVLIEHDGDYEIWLRKRTDELQARKQAQENAYNYLRLEVLIDHLMRFIKHDNQAVTNNMSKRYALLALHSFLPALFRSRYASLALDILVNVLHLRHSTYNLVKCELVDLIASCDFKMVAYVEQQLPSDFLKVLSLKQLQEDYDEEQANLSSFIDLNSNLNKTAQTTGGAKSSAVFNNSTKLCPPQTYMVAKTQDRIIEDVFIYLLGSDDSKVRLETARSFARFILNMSHYEKCTSANQNILLANGEDLLKQTGFAANLFRSGVIDDNDAYNLNYAFLNHQQHQFYQNQANQNSSSSGGSKRTAAAAVQQQMTSMSPLSACSLPSTLPWLSTSKSILNNNFIQPFYSLIKYWPTNASWSSSVSSQFNSIIEHNLSYAVPLLVKALMNASGSDKFLFVGCLEALDFIFQVYSPAIYFSSTIYSSTGSFGNTAACSQNFAAFSSHSAHQQITDLLYLMISFLKYPSVAFDMYVQDIVMRLIGTLLCSYSWLTMRKLDHQVFELNQSLALLHVMSAQPQSKAESKCQAVLELLNNSIKPIVYQQCQAELSTGRAYTYALTFNNLILKTCVDQLFTHCMRMLCLLACVIDENSLPSVLTANLSAGSTAVSPVVPPHAAPPPTAPSAASVATTAALTTTASSSGVSSRSDSPTNTSSSSSSSSKRASISSSTLATKLSAFRSGNSGGESSPALLSGIKSSSKQQQTSSSNLTAPVAAAAGSTPPPPPLNTLPPPPPTKSSSSTTNAYLGYFQNSSVYLKMYETARSGYGTYKKSPSLGTYDKFSQLVKSTLVLFAELLEASLSVHELVPHIDEILLYLRIIFAVESSGSVKCVTMCLRALFGQNLGGLMYDYLQQHINTAATQLAAATATANANSSNNLYAQQQHTIQFSLSSALSGSLPSLASLSGGRRRYHTNNSATSLLTSLVLNQMDRFSSFMMYAASQQQSSRLNTMMFKPSSAIDFSLASAGAITDSSSYSTSSSTSATAGNSNSSSTTTTPTKSSSFSLFGILRKNKPPQQQEAASTSPQQQTQQHHHQMQVQQQEKIKNQKMNLKIMSQYIKSFESIVIKSLRQYTLTTSVNLQTKILELLNQLIYLKVDYSLLDSDKVFIEYVLKQFEHLEQKKSIYGVAGASFELGLLSPQRLARALNEEAAAAAASSLSKSYSIDLYESFDSETNTLDPLNPFDLDTMLNKLHANIRSPQSSSLGASSLTSSTSSIGGSASAGGGLGSSGGGAASKMAGAFGGGETSSTTSPLYSTNFAMKQQEHERFHNLIPKMFDFLILLSHERRSLNRSSTTATSSSSTMSASASSSSSNISTMSHSYSSTSGRAQAGSAKGGNVAVGHDLSSIPEIIQYCDNLIASENSPHTHAIPALRPLVIDLFINRCSSSCSSSAGSSDEQKELEMHQDVVMVAMLRLIQYPQVWPLLTLAVQKYKQDASIIVNSSSSSSAADEKWKRVSRQISDALFDAMRSAVPASRIRFHEFTGNELRAVRRYSRAYTPYIESLKQLFLLLNNLAEQVFRPIDFIILSLFELSKPYVILDTDFELKDSTATATATMMSSFEINNWLCVCLVHLYLLFVQDANENILLIRLHHLMPQIIASYNAAAAAATVTADENMATTFKNKASKNANANANANLSSSEDEGELSSKSKQAVKVAAPDTDRDDYDADRDGSESTCSSTTTEESSSSVSSSVSSVASSTNAGGSSLEYDYDNVEVDMTKAALFFSKFLLRILELALVHVAKSSKAAHNMGHYHSLNLSSSASTAYLKDYQLNQFRDVNSTMHLATNYLYYLVYILNTTTNLEGGNPGGSGFVAGNNLEAFNYCKMASAIASLINNKPLLRPQVQKKSKKQTMGGDKMSGPLAFIDENLKFDLNNFTYHMNQMILAKYAKLNPLLASTWQYLLMLCNYQDPDYWSSSLEEGVAPAVAAAAATLKDDLDVGASMPPPPLESSLNLSSNSASSTAYNSLTHQDTAATAPADTTSKPDFLLLKQANKKQHKYDGGGESCSSCPSAGDSNEAGRTKKPAGNYQEHELVLAWPHVYHLTLNEQLFRYTSIAIYCEHLSTRNQLDNTTGLTMLIINNLIDLFEIASYEPTVLDMFSTVNRNAAASSLFIQSINSKWTSLVAKRKLYLLQACLKSLEGVHLSASGHLLHLLIDKFFHLPYLSLVRHADHIACQRVEMMQSMNFGGGGDNQISSDQLNEKYVARINEFIADHHKYSYRHKRLISLIEQLQQQWTLNAAATANSNSNSESLQSSETEAESLPPPAITPAIHHPLEDLEKPDLTDQQMTSGGMKPSSSIDFFMLYVSATSTAGKPQQSATAPSYQNLDKEWYYNIIRSACCHHSTQTSSSSSSSSIESLIENIQIKAKQCALMLSNLDYSNIMSIMASKEFKLSLLKECLLLGASQSQAFIEKLPSSLKLAIFNNAAASGGAAGLDKDFMHPLWLASTNMLFDLLNELCPTLPKAPLVTLASINNRNAAASAHALYEAKIGEAVDTHDFYGFVSPLTQAINAYLKSIRQYPCLHNQLSTKTTMTTTTTTSASSSSDSSSAANSSIRISTSNIEKLNDLITFITFQLSYVNFMSNSMSNYGSRKTTSSNQQQPCHRTRLTMHALNQSLLSLLNLFIDQNLLHILIERNDYSALMSYIIKDFYTVMMSSFFKYGDENLVHTPLLAPRYNIEYRSNAGANGVSKTQTTGGANNNFTSDMLFSTNTFNLLLKLRYVITNYRLCSIDPTSSLNDVASPSGTMNLFEGPADPSGEQQQFVRNMASCMQSSFTVNTLIHRFMRDQTGYFKSKIPFQMRDLIEKIYLSMCRLPVIDRFVRIPDTLWRTTGFKLDYGQFLRTDSSALPPLEHLRDPQILKEHLKHILCVGWTSRTQFEYEYVNLLTLLHNLSDEYYPPMSPTTPTNMSSSSGYYGNQATGGAGGGAEADQSLVSSMVMSESTSAGQGVLLNMNLPVEEIRERNKCICLVIKGLSSWLIKASLTPTSGNSLNSLYEQVSRNKTPTFLHTRLGRQYGQLKTLLDSFSRHNNFTRMNSISIANNVSLLYMLDPTLIDEFERSNKKNLNSHTRHKNRQAAQAPTQPQPPRDPTQPAPVADALANLFQISMNLSHKSSHNISFVSNNERMMIDNLPSSLDSYYDYTQVSLEGLLKFLGQWNMNNSQQHRSSNSSKQVPATTPITAASIAASISNFVGGSNAGTSGSAVVDEVSSKTATALNSLIKVAEFFTETEEEDSGDLPVEAENDESSQAASSVNYLSTAGPNHSLQQPHQSSIVQRSFNRNNLDITSVLRTVLDYYESFFRHPCLQLKLDIFKSMSYLANCLFDSKQQYESLVLKLQSNFDWLTAFVQQDNYNDQSAALMPIVNELVDDSLLAIGIYSECLCRCCLQTTKSDFASSSMSAKELERLNRLLENGFRSSSLSIKLATVHGLIYWLESITLGYIGNNNDAKLLCDHLCKQINQMKDFSVYLTSNPRYISALWSAVFYAIENCLDSIRDAQAFVQSFIKQTYAILNDPNTPHYLFYQLCMGLERFLLSSMVPSFEINTIQRLHSSKLHDEQRILSLTSLTITSVYAANQTKQLNYWNDIIQPLQQQQQRQSMSNSSSANNVTTTSSNSLDSTPTNSNLSSPMNDNVNYVQQQFTAGPQNRRSSNAPTSNSFSNISINDKSLMSGYPQILELTSYPDLQAHLLRVLEVATGFLDKMKSSPTSKEASVYASILPKLLCDFLPPHDLLNKLITEFLNSSQHPYPEAVAYVLYKCFDLLQEKGLQSQIQEWCLLSLSNFLQRSSIYESIWLTSCLLVSATKNQWLKSTFPFLLNRYCAFDTLDRAIFYMSVIEFRRQFSDPSQIQSINSTFESVAKPGTPYAELVKLLNYQAANE